MRIKLLVTILLLSLFSTSTVFAETDTGHTKGMWVWLKEDEINSSDGREAIVDVAVKDSIDVVYLHTGSDFLDNQSNYKKFITLASENDIEVYALGGSKHWAEEEHHDDALSRVNNIIEYNKSVTQDEKFDGIHFDIEPYLLDQWDTSEKDTLINEYLNGLEKIQNRLDQESQPLPFIEAIPFWFDKEEHKIIYNGEEKFLHNHVLNIVNEGVAIMAYRHNATKPGSNDSIIGLSKQEVDDSEKAGKKAIIGVETKDLGTDKLSFYEESKQDMDIELEEVDQNFNENNGYGGLAIHSYYYYKDKIHD